MRASSVFPILSTILLLLGGLCIGAGRIYSRKNNIVLSAGILFVAAGKSGYPYETRAAAIVVYLSMCSSLPGVCVLVGGQTEIRAWLTLRGRMQGVWSDCLMGSPLEEMMVLQMGFHPL